MSRNVRRPLVVQRTLLPKTQVPTRQIMTLTLLPDVPQLAQKGSFMPVVSQPLAVPISSHPTGFLQPGSTPSIAKILPFHVSTGMSIHFQFHFDCLVEKINVELKVCFGFSYIL